MTPLSKDQKALDAARTAWQNLAPLRTARERQKRYTYGDQWGDTIIDGIGRRITESEAIRQSGRRPLTNNLIRRLVKTVIGHYRQDPQTAADLKPLPRELTRNNALGELDARALEEFLISGCAIQRVYPQRRPGCPAAVYIDNISPDRFFVNDFRDPRGHDITLIGRLHDMPPAQLIARFAHGDRDRALALTRLYTGAINVTPDDIDLTPTPHTTGTATDFHRAPQGLWRAIEVWSLTPHELTIAVPGDVAAKDLWSLQFTWTCRWLAPDGTVLDTYTSPYRHRRHPFAVKFYPLTDGEVHSFVEDIIDQQHYINRVIVLIDKMLGASAKGVLLFPIGQKPEGMSWEHVARTWAKADGIIPITDNTPRLPQQVITPPAADASAFNLLSLELKLFDEISGVTSALRGQNPDSATTGASLYQAQAHNSALALGDIFDSFRAFTADRNRLALNT